MNNPAPPSRRSAGLLLHPVSLPGRFGIGDLGPAARDWIASLARARLSWWQLLPLGPTGYADSPYQSLSSFAGNINLVSPDQMIADRLLAPADVGDARLPDGPVDYEALIPFKRALVRRAWERFSENSHEIRTAFEEFRH